MTAGRIARAVSLVAGRERGRYGMRGIDDDRIEAYLAELKASGESVGALIACTIDQPPAGLGEPVFPSSK